MFERGKSGDAQAVSLRLLMVMNSVHFEEGKNEIVFVFSCPGQEEENSNPPGPAKGQTGKNLEVVLNVLTGRYDLNGFNRNDIVITNSWDKVEYKELTNRSEATCSEILEDNNLNRLSKELKNINKYIVVCGENAKSAINALKYAKKLPASVKIIYVEHLSNRGINSTISKDINGKDIKSYKTASEKPD